MMKNLAFTLGMFIAVSSAFAETPPNEVLIAFQERFTVSSNVIWEKDGELWEADFVMNGKETSAVFGENGKWQETEIAMSIETLPLRISQLVQKSYPKYKLVEIEEVEHVMKGRYFEIELKKGCKHKEIHMDANGEILK